MASKNTQNAAIQPNAYASRPRLDEYMVQLHLEHFNAQRLGTQTTKKKEKAGEAGGKK